VPGAQHARCARAPAPPRGHVRGSQTCAAQRPAPCNWNLGLMGCRTLLRNGAGWRVASKSGALSPEGLTGLAMSSFANVHGASCRCGLRNDVLQKPGETQVQRTPEKSGSALS
jgi:hypothetical protein